MSLDLSILHHNVQHLPSRLDLLEIFLDDSKPDILALTEHKMTREELDILNITNYKLACYYARRLGRGGGVVILVRKGISFKSVNIPSVNSLLIDKVFECCLTEIKTSKFSFLLGCMYRSPNNSNLDTFFENFEILLDILSKKFKKLVITGDFNIDVLNKNECYKKLINILNIYEMTYLVDFPTRVTEHSGTAIDNFFTNIESKNLKVTGLVTQISDHDGQLMELLNADCDCTKAVRKKVRKFDQGNLEIFCRNLSSETWAEVFQSHESLKYDKFFNIFKFYFDVNFPKLYVTDKTNKSNQWIDQELKSKKTDIINLETQFRIFKDNNLKKIIKTKKVDLKQNIIRNKRMYFEGKIMNAKNKVKTTWSLINSEVGKQSSLNGNIKLFHQSKYITDPMTISETFNSFFINAVNNLTMPNNVTTNSRRVLLNLNTVKKPFQFSIVSEEEIKNIILSFENKYSAGYDEIPITVIKVALPFICSPLTHIINHSLTSGIFPEKFKIARVIPIFKKGNLEDIKCYRPVSILSVFSKILEKVVYNQFNHYLEANKLLDEQQHGFRSNKSTITAGIQFIESIIDAVDRGEKAVGVFLDLSRAFDSVVHDELLEVLSTLGVENIELAWFKSYLLGRKQFVEIDHFIGHVKIAYKEKYISRLLTVKYGVPQGSILGPLLFLCYLKGLPEIGVDKNSICLYADDTNLIVTAESEEKIEISTHIGLSLVKDFLNSKNLLLNSSKSNFVSFSTMQARSKLNPTIFVENHILDQVCETKFLGLIIDENLSWDEHVESVIRKTSSGLFALRKMSKSCNIKTLKTIYFALVHSHIAYGICIYGSSSKRNMDRILVQQKRALRIILNLKQTESVKRFYAELNILTVYSLYIYETIKHVFLNKKITIGNMLHSYNTRPHRVVEHHRLEFFKKKTTYKGNRFFDCLPINIKLEKNPKKFLSLLKCFLIQSAYYSIQEFEQQTMK